MLSVSWTSFWRESAAPICPGIFAGEVAPPNKDQDLTSANDVVRIVVTHPTPRSSTLVA